MFSAVGSGVASFEDILDLHNIGAVAISPHGRAVAYIVRSTNWEDNEHNHNTEIRPARLGDDPIQLTRTEQGSSTSPAWSPDDRWIAFLADRGHDRQIHLLNPRGGQAWALTEVEESTAGFAWAQGVITSPLCRRGDTEAETDDNPQDPVTAEPATPYNHARDRLAGGTNTR